MLQGNILSIEPYDSQSEYNNNWLLKSFVCLLVCAQRKSQPNALFSKRLLSKLLHCPVWCSRCLPNCNYWHSQRHSDAKVNTHSHEVMKHDDWNAMAGTQLMLQLFTLYNFHLKLFVLTERLNGWTWRMRYHNLQVITQCFQWRDERVWKASRDKWRTWKTDSARLSHHVLAITWLYRFSFHESIRVS